MMVHLYLDSTHSQQVAYIHKTTVQKLLTALSLHVTNLTTKFNIKLTIIYFILNLI